MQKQRDHIPLSEVRQKIYRYCAYQERCHTEVREKLFELGARKGEVDEIITELITQGFLNEERFARSFAGGKFRLKSWGRLKIIHALEGKGLTTNCIKAGLTEIDEADYGDTLLHLIRKKSELLTEDSPYLKRDKIGKYLIHKGFEPELVWPLVKAEVEV